jgi:hypothetical protein
MGNRRHVVRVARKGSQVSGGMGSAEVGQQTILTDIGGAGFSPHTQNRQQLRARPALLTIRPIVVVPPDFDPHRSFLA